MIWKGTGTMNTMFLFKRMGTVQALLAVLAFLFVAPPVLSQQDGNIAEQAALVTEFEVNGLKVLVKNRPSSSTVAAGLFIKGGARNVTEESAGIENLMLETAVEGSANFPREVLRKRLANTGTEIGSGINSDYSVLSLASTKEHFQESWRIFADIAMNPKFDPADLARVKERILTGLREAETDNDGFLEVLQERIVYKGHPYSVDVRGTLQTIPRFEVKDVRGFHGQVMQTSRLLLVVVGDVNAEEFRGWVARSLGNLPEGKYEPVKVPEISITKPALDVTRRQLPTNYVQGVFNAPGLGHADYYPMKIAIALLQARVFQEVRVERQLSYAPNAELNSNAANTGFIYVTTVDPNEAVSVMLGEMENLKTRAENPRLLSSISGHFLTLHYIDQETNGAQAREMAKYELIGGGWRNAFGFLEKVKAVTPAQVQTVARKYFKNLHFIVIGDPAIIDQEVFLGSSGTDAGN
ncbi:MAG: insulinase family protein [Acidobacteria bacterium]|nr:MAG: insulinase family protein [Acidobacteriota bacterium]REJ98347.1 MAG: insulinase family protein [Acidobacteriota bacterium]REK17091.1 MAG: insulinase family protein [Acidobacteriota bacterium]REK43001.1 MAG: insulinase family protein [Acidobacteriota bacterium]